MDVSSVSAPLKPQSQFILTRRHCVLKQILRCCIFDAARAQPAHYEVVIQKYSPEGPLHRISLSKVCYGYHDLRQRATLQQQVPEGGWLAKNNSTRQ